MIDRPRVLYLCGWPMGARGEGAASFVFEQIDALASSVRATFLDPRFTTIARWPFYVVSGGALAPIVDLWERDVTAVVGWIPRWPSSITARNHLDDLRMGARRLARHLVRRFGGFDLVHAHVVLPAGLAGAALADELQIPVLLQEHSAPFEMHLETGPQRDAVRFALARTTRIVAVGEDLARRIREFAGDRAPVSVVPNLVRTDLFRPQPHRRARSGVRLISVSSLESRKGIADLLDAVHALKRSGMAISARIIGEGSDRSALELRISALGLDNDVLLVGSRTRAEVAETIADSDIYVCSSLLETFGLAPAEALAVGRPVVTTRCGGPESFVDDSCGTVVPAGAPSALAQGIRAVAERLAHFDPARLHQQIDERFGPEAFRTRMLALYRAMLNA